VTHFTANQTPVQTRTKIQIQTKRNTNKTKQNALETKCNTTKQTRRKKIYKIKHKSYRRCNPDWSKKEQRLVASISGIGVIHVIGVVCDVL